jgi:UDP-N-acetyl-D-mannosaminuronate dehydrogenase
MYEFKLAIIGLGYVGLPLAIEFARRYSVIGFDINRNRVEELRSGHDATLEVDDQDLQTVLTKHEDVRTGLFVTDSPMH